VIATGGLSHAPAVPGAERIIDEAFDREFLAHVEAGNHAALVGLANSRIDAAGYGAWELRMWLTMLGTVPERKGDILAYEAVPEWETGCAIATIK
jgi:protocatechuate 4,5-dioxygenase beta chain/2,3-dihydroxyphenylpropionate 1,2-dioxygenase